MTNNLNIRGGVAIIEKDKKYFLVQQSHHKPCGGQWRHPGGRFNPGEDPTDGLIREVKEETGLDIEISDGNPVHVEKSDYAPFYFGFYRTRYKGGKIKLDKREAEDAGWYNIEEINKLNLMPATKNFYKKYSHIFEDKN